MIRLAHARELAALRELERAAGTPFREVGMAEIADDEPFSVAELRPYQADGRCWVAAPAGTPVAYLVADVVDGNGHVEQVSVRPSHARRGLGRRLIDAAAAWAASRGLPALTLTTFRDVPWNAPYYARLGFRVLPAAAWGPELRAIREHEAARGLDRWPRVAMIR
ncbi:GNAT family N-acetyltransferase [Amycolatopsis sp. FDAARGOS 1241]|uniref:GNAT family N-acetyltransferase n=1 Tax=Amycolatopsis sp. FDAARGOS 1241 TaxID=2778070 RepID=UPI00195249FA|nr:GNAT family N-acetyltransferase [Amycolatopsis sp. FDAARGOS 1241]QRP47372.1 GNAT family N-acetyltransferase [Amycolatopsis sp. FDAARGOS 1241]